MKAIADRKTRIAIVGSRGIPATYGGYETITQELSIGLVERGFEVYVACESNKLKSNPFANFHNVKLVYFPIINSIRTISDVLTYDALAVLWASFNVDIIYMLSYTNSPLLLFPRLLGKTVVANADGLEWKRRKHSKFLRMLLRSFEALSLKVVNCMVVDSKALGRYFEINYNVPTEYLPYGTREIMPLSSLNLRKYGLETNNYYLVIARLEPENNIDIIIREFNKSNSKKKLVVVGPLKNTPYVKKLLSEKSKKIIFTGGIYEQQVQRMLRHNCFAYIHGHEVGGTNPTLVEALSCRNLTLAFDVPFNKEVAGPNAIYFNKENGNLRDFIDFLEEDVKNNPQKYDEWKQQAYDRYQKKYSISGMVDACAVLFNKLT
jgi:glycosyltransferase involved in cell wall biosynthesis